MAGGVYTYDGGTKIWRLGSGTLSNINPVKTITRGTTYIEYADTGPRRAAAIRGRNLTTQPLVTYPGSTAVVYLDVDDQVIEFADFGTRRVVIRAKRVKLFGCNIRNTNAAHDSGIDCGNANTEAAIIEYCDIVNAANNYNCGNAIQGHDFTLRGCYTEGWIDSVGIWNTTLTVKSNPVNVFLYENLFGKMAYYTGTFGQVHPSDDNTHNEQVQWHNGSNCEIIGNVFIVGFVSHLGQPGSIGTAGHGHALNISFPVGPSYNHKVNDNWIEGDYAASKGGNVAFNFGTDPAAGLENLGEILRNKFNNDFGPEALIFIDTKWTGSFGIGNANANCYMNSDKTRNTSAPVPLRRNV